ncbi:unnamed protein product [Sphagnum jensenii]|uniref:RIN4 pathogenic type III effector avirulence factor Avr cleavage site domain-containing protein n=1 Tax=Sphagnum jensenii TaxID=128206 RepID=A0ABP0W605_9BRYO
MQNRPHVPKFGNWDANANTPAYTAVFEHARAEKGGKIINPNDPAENPALAAAYGYLPPSEDRPVAPRGRTAVEAPHQRHEHAPSQEEADTHHQTEHPGRYSQEPSANRADNPRYVGRGGPAGGPTRAAVPSDPPRRGVIDRDSNHNSDRSSAEGSSHNTDRSPMHPSYPGRLTTREAGRGASSPAWEKGRRASGDDGLVFAPGTPVNKSRLRTGAGRPEEPPAKGGTLPKFGAWDAKDPTAGEGFTMIFQKASVEKKEGGPVRIPQMNEPAASSFEDPHQRQPSERSRKQTQSSGWLCCFSK